MSTYIQWRDHNLPVFVDSAKEDFQVNPVEIMPVGGAANHVCPFAYGERFSLTDATACCTYGRQRRATNDSADVRQQSRMLLHGDVCGLRHDDADLVLRQQWYRCATDNDKMQIRLGERFQIPSIQQGQGSLSSPTASVAFTQHNQCSS